MAMLAEPKRRQKWSLNPRGTLWSNDQNKFGQKLMEKMGWNKGEGCGKDGQGITDAIKANYKDNNKGIGYNKGKDDEWVKHYDAFENVLAALNSENNSKSNSPSSSPANSPSNSPANSGDEDEETKSNRSLEKRSKNSRARVHYHKFTRGKDLNRYTEDDLACIVGSKRSKRKDPSKNATLEVKVKEEVIENEKDEVGTTKNVNGVVTIVGGNYHEYFAKKMAELKKRKEANMSKVNDIQVKVEVKEEAKEESSPLKINEDTSLETKKSKKKKKKCKDNEVSFTCDDNDVDQHESQVKEEVKDDNESLGKEKKHKKSKTDASNSNMVEKSGNGEDGRTLFNFELSCGFTNGSTIKKYPINKYKSFSSDDEVDIKKEEKDLENTTPKSKKKKHKVEQDSLDEIVESKEKKKKKKSKETMNQNENSENTCEEVIKKTKKKKSKNNDEVEKNSVVIENENAMEFEEKEKVKKKKMEEAISSEGLPENTESKKKKKKKNKSKHEDDNAIMEEEPEINNDENVNLNEKRKGKKRKREEEEIDTDDSSKSKKSKKSTDNLSHEASPGKNKLKRKEYWKNRTEEISKKKKTRSKQKKSKNKYKASKDKNKDTIAKKVIQAFEGAKVPNIIAKREKRR